MICGPIGLGTLCIEPVSCMEAGLLCFLVLQVQVYEG